MTRRGAEGARGRAVVVIGATGHIGSYLVPRLVAGGHEVIAMSRGLRGPYLPSPRWDSVTMITVDRAAADADGSLEALFEALAWLVADGQVDVGGQQFHLTT